MIQAANAASMRVSCDVNPSVRYIDPWEEVLTQAKSLTVGNIWAILRNTTEPFGNLANQIYGWFEPFEGPIFDYNATEFVLYQEFGLDSVGFYTGKAIGDVESMAINALLMFSGLSGYAKGLSGFGNIGGMSGSGAALSPSLAYAGEGVLVSAGTSVGTVVLGYGFQNAQSDFDFAKQAWDNSWFGPGTGKGEQSWSPSNIRNENSSHTRLTGKDADAAARSLGYKKTNYKSHGQPVYKKGNRYITPDVDSHNGGVWKMADSVKNLGSKSTRMGTYDANLIRIGD